MREWKTTGIGGVFVLWMMMGTFSCDKLDVDPNELRLDYHPALSSASKEESSKTSPKTSLQMANLGMVRGQVVINEHQKPEIGGRLVAGDILHGRGGKRFVELTLIDGSVLRAENFGTLTLEEVVFKIRGQPLRRLVLQAEGGDWWLDAGELPGIPGEIEVKTPQMTLLLRDASTVRLSFGAESLRVEVHEGKAELTRPGEEKSLTVSKGQEVRLSATGDFTEPQSFIGEDRFLKDMRQLDKGLKAFRDFTKALQKQGVAALIFPPDGPSEDDPRDDEAEAKHAEHYYHVMQPRFEAHQWATLEPNLRIFIESNPRPSSVKARVWLAECLLDQHRYNEAARVTGEIFRRFPKNEFDERLKAVLDNAAAGLVSKATGTP